MTSLIMKEGIVCIFDILGTKETWREDNSKDIIEKRQKLLSDHKKMISESKDINNDISMQSISDTIILSTHFNAYRKIIDQYYKYKEDILKPKSRIKQTYFAIIDQINPEGFQKNETYFKRLISITLFESLLINIVNDYIKNDLFVRGSISIGKYYCKDSTVIIGPAINIASREYEKANWIGIHYDPSSTIYLKKYNIHHTIYKVPFKGYYFDLACINWIKKVNDISYYTKKLEEKKVKIENKIKEPLTDVVSAMNIEKYNNTISFVKTMYNK